MHFLHKTRNKAAGRDLRWGLGLGLLVGLCLSGAPSYGKTAPQAPRVGPAAAQIMPNLYVLKGGSIEITYSTSGIDGRPHFTYKDGQQTQSFSGDEIRCQPSEIGTLVSVTIRRTVDTGSTSFTLILPPVDVAQSGKAQISTEGITTVHRFSPVPSLNRGQRATYQPAALTGTAEHVAF